MLLNTDQDILDNYEKLITSEPTIENLEACGCIKIKDNGYGDLGYVIIYKGERYVFTRIYEYGKFTLQIYCKHYTNTEKTAWVSYGHEYAKNLKELFAWIDAEIEFYKDHPEEKYGTLEYECKRKRQEVVGQVFDELRWKFNLNQHSFGYCSDSHTVGYAPKDDDDVVWYSLYAEACKIANQEHPELFEK